MYRNLDLNMEGEIWKDVVGYEGLYEVSNMGRVKALNFKRSGKEKIIKQTFSDKGYLMASLTKDGKKKTLRVHRLVATAFIENIGDKPCVDHKNTIKTDNRVENLRFVTHKENNNNELTRKHNSESKKGKKHTEETRKKISKNSHKYKGFICIFEDGSITEEMSCEKLGKLLGIDGEMIRYVAKSNKPYKPRLKKLRHLNGIRIYYAEDYLKLESGDKIA